MPTLQELVDGTYRDLADETKVVFSQLLVEDFVRGGIADLNRVAPQDSVDDLVLVTDVNDVITQFAYDTPIELPYRVEVIRLSDGARWDISAPVDGLVNPQGGYTFRRTPTGGTIEFPKWYLQQFNATELGIRLTGYAPRPLPYAASPSPSVSISEEEIYSVRSYAKQAGFDLLAHDRSLFAQWQGQTNNTDVSPTQMMQMAAGAKQEWDRHRGLIRTVRKFW